MKSIFIILFFICFLNISFSNISYNNCLKFNDIIKNASYELLGINYPYWYNISLMYVESNCKWVIGKDRHGSIGYAQIIPSLWDRYLLKYYPEYKVKDHLHHFYAFIFILKVYKQHLEKHNLCKNKLWVLYQMYNGGFLVLKECNKSNSCEWNKCKEFCNRKIDCIYYDKSNNTCKQYKSLCDVNYSYSHKVFNHGNRIKNKIKENENYYVYW